MSREPELTKISEFTAVSGENVGAFNVVLLGQYGNCDVPQQFTYDTPTQEAVLGESQNIKVDVIDAIVKDKA